MAVRKLYKVTRENKKDEKFAPQAQAILDTIRGLNAPVERGDLIAVLDKSGVLKTRQGSARVFSFFRPKLIEAGILKEIKEEVATEKPAKAAKTEKAETKAPAKGKTSKKSE